MFQKKDAETNFDIVIGSNSIIKGDIESEGSIRVDGKIFGSIISQGNIIISENAYVKGNITSLNADIYGACEGDVRVKGKINIHQNSTLAGDILAKSFNTKEGSTFKGNCVIDPNEDLVITVDPMIHNDALTTNQTNLLDFSKTATNKTNEKQNEKFLENQSNKSNNDKMNNDKETKKAY